MADKAGLQRGLKRYFSGPENEKVIAAVRLAKAYTAYAYTTKSCLGLSPLPGSLEPKKAALVQGLVAAWSSGFNSSRTLSGVAAAFSAFWLLPPVAFPGATPGAVVAAPYPPLFVALRSVAKLAAAKAQKRQTNTSQLAALWARALDSWTLSSVVVTHLPLSACTGPLT